MSLISKVKLPGHNTPYDIGVQWDNVKEKPDFYPAAAGIPYGEVDTSSTATVFTATIPGITELKDGVCMLLKNGVVTSASGFTININGLGAKPSYNNMTTGNDITPTYPTRDTTVFNINYTMLFIYSETIVSGGAWICYRGYDTNTIGYQLRTNTYVQKTLDAFSYNKILFTSANGNNWVPAASEKVKSSTSQKTVNQRPIDPFGKIVYCAIETTNGFNANADVTKTICWQQYVVTLGYSFNTTGKALTLTTRKPVYVKCTPQTNGSAIINSTTPIVQNLPTTEDNSIYIFLGIATSATAIELLMNHPVYQYKNGAIRLYTNADIPTKVSELTNDSGFLTATDNFGAIRISSDAQSVPANAEQISPNNTIILNKIAKTGSYTDLFNRPTNVSAFTNDANYINQTQLNTAISNVNQFNVQIVTSLPTANIDTHTIYFISNSGSGQNIYDEYMYLNNKWEKIGTTDVDLSGYLKKTDIAAWAKATTKPTYNATEVGAIPSTAPAAAITSANISNWNDKVELLIGATTAITPSQAATAFDAGKRVILTHTGTPTARSGDTQAQAATSLLSNITIQIEITGHYATFIFGSIQIKYNNLFLVCELEGYTNVNTWQFYLGSLGTANADSLENLSQLNNDIGYITSANVATYQVQPDWNATNGKGQILNKPTIPAAPGTLNTNNTTAQTVSTSEALSGAIKLHKISKTGNYNDLLNKPTIPTVPTKVSAFTNDSGYVKWDELWVYMES